MYYSDIAGQEDIKKFLVNSIKYNRVSHCYIFEGPKGMGKYDLSLIFAQSLLCNNFSNEPCNNCEDCKKVNTFNHPDLHIINNDENTIKKEEIDELIDTIYKKPYESQRKVFIINNAQDMTLQASNAFLKTLEEPPGDSTIILLTNNIGLLLPTIVSRSQIIKFSVVDKNEIIKYLIEKLNINKSLAEISANYSKGILNKAVNIAAAKDNILEFRKEIISLFNQIINSDSEIIFEYENYFEEQKDNIDIIIELIMIFIRDIIFIKYGIENQVINQDYTEFIKNMNYKIEIGKANDLIQYLQTASDNIKYNVNYTLALDKLLLKIQEAFI